MKYLVSGDFHIKRERLKECKDILDQILKLSKGCKGLIILGDVFDTDNPKPDEIDFFIKFLKQIPLTVAVYIIGGNHGRLKSDINATMWSPKIHPNIIYGMDRLLVDLEGRNIRMQHINCAESKFGANNFQKEGPSFKDFKEDIVLLGHIHKYQILSEKPRLVLHPGAPYYIHFGEHSDKKGIIFLDIDKEITYKFIPLKVIPMHQIIVKDDELGEIYNILEKVPALSKLKIIFEVSNTTIDTSNNINRIVEECRKKYHIFKWTIKVQSSVAQIKESISQKNTAELLKDFCKEKKIGSEIRKLLQGLLEVEKETKI